MNFSRSNQGLNNIHLFFGAKKMIYIEGEDNTKKFDKKFYELIYEKILGINPTDIYIQPLGSCSIVLDRYNEILASNITNSICVIDNDYNSLKSNLIFNSDYLKTTFGYSWESDFWSKKLLLKLIDFFSGSNLGGQRNTIDTLIDNTLSIASKISIFDLIAQIYGASILIKNTSSFGLHIAYDVSFNTLISRREYVRMRSKLPDFLDRDCSISREIYKSTRKIKYKDLIQGHFLQKISIELILKSLALLNCGTTICHDLICNSAQSMFIENFNELFDSEAREYYSRNFAFEL